MAEVGEPIYFPPVTTSLEGGLLRVGGQLTPDWLLAAYGRGIFPWPVIEDEWEVLAWFSPDPRAVIELDCLHVSRRLARRIRSGTRSGCSCRRCCTRAAAGLAPSWSWARSTA